MKKFFTHSYLLVLLMMGLSFQSFSQQTIGTFPYMDGGFEAQATGALGTVLSPTAWSRQSQAGASTTIATTTPRSGSNYATITNVATVSRGLQSPQTATVANGPQPSTIYTIQYFIKNPSIASYTESINTNGTTNTAYGTAVTVAANATWTKRTVTQTSATGVNTAAGVLITARSASAVTFDIDDIVLYAGALDNSAPSIPGAVTVNGATINSLNVSWGAASGGVDGGGYVVIRYAVNPNADNDPNQNGIYAVGNTTTNGTGSLTGTIRYIGTGTSFTDNVGLLSNATYYYKVYTVDKAFNYSNETQSSGTLLIATPATTSISPTSVTAASGPFTLTVNGTNFFNGVSTVTWNGSPRTTTYVSSTQLTAAIPGSDITSAGTVNVGVTNTGAATPNSNTQTITIAGGASQTITFSAIATMTYGDAPFNPGATSNSGLTVSYTSSNTAVATVSGNMITIVGAGTSNITASQSGNATYGAASPVMQTLTVNPKTLTVSGVVAHDKLYDGGNAATITYSSIIGVVGGDVITVTGGGTFASAIVGTDIGVTANLVLGGADANNYILTQPTGLTADITDPILAWEFLGKAGNETSVNSTTTNTNLTTSVVTRGAGLTATALPDAFSSSGFVVNGTYANAVASNNYLQFTVNAKSGYQVSLKTLDANFRRSATGPNTFQWQYSLDGFATAGTNIGSAISYSLVSTNGDAQTQINLSTISALQNVSTVGTITFRLYAYGATNIGGTFAFGKPATPVNDIAIDGSVTAAPVSDVTISSAHPAANTVDQGTTDAIIGEFFLDVNTNPAYLLGLAVNMAGTYVTSDITNIKFWGNFLPNLSSAVQLGATQAVVASGSSVGVTGVNYTIPTNATRYILVTASVASAAQPGHTIYLNSTSFSNINLANATKTGTNPVAASNPQTITLLDPTIAISDVSPAASTFNQNSTKQLLSSIKLDITATTATLTGITMTPNGSYHISDLAANPFRFYINTTNNVNTATQLGVSQAAVAPGTDVSITGLSQVLSNNSTYYIFLTTDIAFNAVAGRTIETSATPFNNIMFVGSNKTGTDPLPNGNTHTIAAVVPSIVLAGGGPGTAATYGAPSSGNILYQFNLTPSANSAMLTQLNFKVGGTVVFSDFVAGSLKLFYNTANTFATATQVATGVSMVNTGSIFSFTNLNQPIILGTTGYFWVTGNVSASAITGHTVSINALSTANIIFSQGNKSGTATSSALFTLARQPTLTDIITPQYTQGNSTSNTTRTPYIFRAKLSNLIPNATYKYYNLVVTAADAATVDGAGTVIFPSASFYNHISTPSMTAGNFASFIADATGSYTGWFISEPTGNARFTPGNVVYQRIMLNDGAGGTSVASRVTTTTSSLVINYVSGTGANNGTGIRGNSSGTQKNIVLLYDNVNGTGRPVSAAQIEADGYTTASYVPFYTTSVDGQLGAWGNIIPNSLPNGIRRIEQRSITDGSIVNCPSVSLNGTWPSGVNTVNPTSGATELVIAASDAPLNSPIATWLGNNNNWNDASNWICGVPNSNTSDVLIPSNASIMPKLYSDVTIHNLNLQGSSSLDLAVKTLTIAGAISGTGNLKGSDFSGLTISGAAGNLNFAIGTRTLKTFILNSGATATLGSTLDITSANAGGNLIVNSGATLTTGNNLTIKSSISGTANVGPSPGVISGNVLVERYIPQNAFRAWRLLSVPVQGTTTFKQSWQEGQAAMANGIPGYGVLLTSTSGGNGYDAATAGNSLLKFTPGNPGSFSAVSNTNNMMITNAGYFVYVRGNRAASLTGGAFNPSPTTLRCNGPLYTGTQPVININPGDNVLVGNIYASAVDFNSLLKNNVTSFRVWDPKLQGTYNLGAYQLFSSSNGYNPIPGGGSYAGLSSNTRIESGQAFIVTSSGGGNIQFTEGAKISGSRNVFRNSTLYKEFKASLIAYTSTGLSLADGNTTVYDSAFSNNVDNDDVTKINNFGENFGILRNGLVLALEARMPIVLADTIFYKIWNLKQQQYQLRFVASNLNIPGLTATLVDNFLSTSTPVNVVDTTFIDFTVTSNALSYAPDRFKIIFKVTAVMPVTFTGIKASEREKKVSIDWHVAAEQNIDHYEVEHSINSRNFEKIGSVQSKGNAFANDYNFIDQQPQTGDNFYRVKAVELSGKTVYTSVVKVNVGNREGTFSINPNPVVNNKINLYFNSQPKGLYTVRLLNDLGQAMLTKIFNHEGESNVKTINLPPGIIPGIYQLEIIHAGFGKSVEKFILNKNN